MQALKLDDPNLKTLLAIGGWTHGSSSFTEMVATSQNRAQFVGNSMAYIQRYGKIFMSIITVFSFFLFSFSYSVPIMLCHQ